jgi:hypothetical protein
MKTYTWKIQRALIGVDNWDDCGDEIFSTIAEARNDLKEFINDCVDAYKLGYMSDYPKYSEFRIVRAD